MSSLFKLADGLAGVRLWARLPSGWRKAAIINVALTSTGLLLLVGILCAAISKTAGVRQAWIFYTAKCTDVSIVNTLAHLFLNAASTGVLASSNFFMQVCNAPTRKEIDIAHAKGDWLDIGVPSWHNALRISRFKFIAWFVLFLTSVPIHLVFNSSIFVMDSLNGDYHATIATKDFVNGEPYFLPGASLITGQPSEYMGGFGNSSLLSTFQEYFNKSASQSFGPNIPGKAARWHALTPRECMTMYADGVCAGLGRYRDVIFVAEGSGWKRSEVWNLSTAADRLWESVVPRNQTNTVFFSTQCQMSDALDQLTSHCTSDCNTMISAEDSFAGYIDITNWQNISMSPYSNTSLYSAPDGNISEPIFQNGRSLIQIESCLAEPRDSKCSIAISNPLLLTVAICILLKVIAYVIVIRVLGSEEPLATPGDAIASFLTIQGEAAAATGPATRKPGWIRSLLKTERADYIMLQQNQPKQWAARQPPRASVVPRTVWRGTYFVLILGIFITFNCLIAQQSSGIPLRWSKLNNGRNMSILGAVPSGTSFVSSLLIVNTPQLYLSFSYLWYNALVTRLEMSREWAAFFTKFRPLRVTRPRGQQVATYRLQLPYKYSIPLIVLSAFMHWLLSNSLFILVTQGNYYNPVSGGYWQGPVTLPDDATAVIGTATLPLLIFGVLGLIMAIIPTLMGSIPLPGYMPIVGSNSLAMLAACQVSPLVQVPELAHDDDENEQATELEELNPKSDQVSESENSVLSSSRENMAFRLLKWGEVQMPEEWCRKMQDTHREHTTDTIRHLSFGTILDSPQAPTEGRWYI